MYGSAFNEFGVAMASIAKIMATRAKRCISSFPLLLRKQRTCLEKMGADGAANGLQMRQRVHMLNREQQQRRESFG
jgi:hypothetical protein